MQDLSAAVQTYNYKPNPKESELIAALTVGEVSPSALGYQNAEQIQKSCQIACLGKVKVRDQCFAGLDFINSVFTANCMQDTISPK